MNEQSSLHKLPKSAHKHLIKGQRLIDENKFKEALIELNLALAEQPEDISAIRCKIFCYRKLALKAEVEREFKLAITYLKDAHLLAPNDSGVHNELARLRRREYLEKNNQSTVKMSASVSMKKISVVENLVFQGGGIKDIGIIGALRKFFEQYADINQIKRLGGASGGSIIALALGLGYSLDEVEKILKETDIPSFMDGKFRDDLLYLVENRENIKQMGKGIFQDVKNIKNSSQHPFGASAASAHLSALPSNADFKTILRGFKLLNNGDMGLFPGDFFREQFLEPVIQAKTGIPYLTFRELHDLIIKYPAEYGHLKDISVVAVDIHTGEIKVFSYETTPDLIISDAIRASMSIPLVFQPHVLHYKINGQRVPDPAGHWFVDGGLLDNCPSWLFDKLPDGRFATNPLTLAFRLVPEAHKKSVEEMGGLPTQSTPDSLASLVWRIINTVKHKQHSDHVKLNEMSRTIYINHLGINTVEFNLDEAGQNALKKNGADAVEHYFSERHTLASTLHHAVKAPNLTEIETLLNQGIDGNITDSEGLSVLDHAIAQDNKPLLLLLVMKGVYRCNNPGLVVNLINTAMESPFIDKAGLSTAIEKFIALNNVMNSRPEVRTAENSTVRLAA